MTSECSTSAFVIENADVSELVDRLRNGDREAFGELFNRFHQIVYSIVLARVKSEHDAEDVTQDVFLNALQKIDSLREPHAFGAWLCSIANHMALNLVFRKGVVGARVHSLDEEELAVEDPRVVTSLDMLLKKEVITALREKLLCLKDGDYKVIHMFHIQHMTLLEMQKVLSEQELRCVPLGTVKRRLFIARARLEKEMSRFASQQHVV
jgi:RNA polymerase sigma-70 factor (ECF subfamily)